MVTGILGGGSQRPSPPHSTKFCRSTKSKQTGVQTQLAKPETSDSPSSAISSEDSCAPPRTACPQKNASWKCTALQRQRREGTRKKEARKRLSWKTFQTFKELTPPRNKKLTPPMELGKSSTLKGDTLEGICSKPYSSSPPQPGPPNLCENSRRRTRLYAKF